MIEQYVPTQSANPAVSHAGGVVVRGHNSAFEYLLVTAKENSVVLNNSDDTVSQQNPIKSMIVVRKNSISELSGLDSRASTLAVAP